MFTANTISNTFAVVKGSSHVLICNVKSRPASVVTWSYDSVITATHSNSTATNGYYTFSIGGLSIPNATSSMDRKIVTCTGTPVYGNPIHRSTMLIIQCKLFSIQFFFYETTPLTPPLDPALFIEVLLMLIELFGEKNAICLCMQSTT